MSRNLKLYLEDIINSCHKIIRYTEKLDYDGFISNELVYDAVIRNLQVIGEAVKQIPPEIRNKYPQIEWRKIAGLRDILVHAYFSLEDETIWNILETKIFLLQSVAIIIINQEYLE